MGRRPKYLSENQPPRTRLEEVRRWRGILRAHLARMVGMQGSHLYRIESGEAELTRTYRDKVAHALGVTWSQLFEPIGAPILAVSALPQEVFETRAYEPAHAAPAVGARLAAVMRHVGLHTAAALAPVIGATEPEILDWLDGRALPPTLPMRRLAGRAGVTMTWIYYGDESSLLPGVAEQLRRWRPPDR